MFCPVCHAEYRPGFTHCADCDVDLVPSLDEAGIPAASARQSDNDTAAVVWAGVDPRLADLVCRALADANIDYIDEQPDSVLLPAIHRGMHEIRVSSADLEAAQKAIAERWSRPATDENESSENSETATEALSRSNATVNPFHFQQPVFNRPPEEQTVEQSVRGEADEESIPNDYVENFDPEEATVLIWSGEDSQMGPIFKDCLSNVGIGCVLKQNSGKTELYVMPPAEKRAREVVREIEEGTPMQ
jgi:hypothetical protein